MTARRFSVATATVALAVLAAACGTPVATSADPDLRPTDAEAGVAVTVPSGPESLPTWQRTGHGTTATAVLVVPADLLFARDSANLSPSAARVLEQVVGELAPGKQVKVEGHADSDGELAHNQALSERRATAVAGWLTGHGVPPGAVAVIGWGEARPAVEEIDEAAKAKNRRVVVTVSSSPAAATATTPATVRPVAVRPRTIPGRRRAGRSTPRVDDPPLPRRSES